MKLPIELQPHTYLTLGWMQLYDPWCQSCRRRDQPTDESCQAGHSSVDWIRRSEGSEGYGLLTDDDY